MSFLSDLEKTVRANHILVFLGAIVLVYAVYTYSDQKFVFPANTMVSDANNRQIATGHQAVPVATTGANGFSAVDSITGQGGAPPAGASNMPVANPSDLLPRDTNNQWGSLNPAGSGDLSGQSLLTPS